MFDEFWLMSGAVTALDFVMMAGLAPVIRLPEPDARVRA
jgi:hypothetical protein